LGLIHDARRRLGHGGMMRDRAPCRQHTSMDSTRRARPGCSPRPP
jgi:hypothetical protein